MHSTLSAKLTAALLAISVAGCGGVAGLPDPLDLVSRGTNRAAGTAVDTAASRTGQAVGDRIGNQLGGMAAARAGAAMSPMLTQFYMSFVFAMAFNQGGYQVHEVAYRPGDWTRWSIPNPAPEEDEPAETILERAYLFDDADGNAWWKVKYVLDPAKAADTTLVVEALFDRKASTLLRMRAKMPNEKEGKEVPVTEATYYVPPQKLTKQSIQGATKGVVPVKVPAGAFKARHVVFGDAGGGTAEWYLVDKVPGGSVKFVHRGPSADTDGDPDPQNHVMNLVTFGKGAASELGVVR